MNPLEENSSFRSSSLTDALRHNKTQITKGSRNKDNDPEERLKSVLRDVGQVQRSRRGEDVVEVFRSGFLEAVEGGA